MWWVVLWAQQVSATPVESWLDAVVRVEQGSSFCSGTTVTPHGLILTAYHCVASGGEPRVEFRDGTVRQGRVVGTDVRADLALIETEVDRSDAWLPLSLEAPKVGSWVVALGHPISTTPPLGFLEGTLHWSATDGMVSAVGPLAVQTNALVAPGHSGGPLVDEQGRLVGVVSRRLNTAGFGFATRPELAAALLEAPPESLGLWGGTFSLRVGAGGGVRATDAGYADFGVELALRDRVWVSGDLNWAPSAQALAEGLGEAFWPAGSYGVGLRQRVGHGDWTLRLDAGVGVSQWVGLQEKSGALTAAPPFLEVGGVTAVSVRGLRWVGRWPSLEGPSTWTLFLDWPGVLSVF